MRLEGRRPKNCLKVLLQLGLRQGISDGKRNYLQIRQAVDFANAPTTHNLENCSSSHPGNPGQGLSRFEERNSFLLRQSSREKYE